jgi:hypothetical protein
MQSDIKYHGIYRGTVVATNDPENLGRVTLIVPQVSGNEVTNWAYPIIGVPENRKVPFGSFFDYTNQYAGSLTATTNTVAGGALVDTPIAMRLNTTDATATQYTFVDGGNNTQITFEKAGIYNFQWSGQFRSSDTGDHDVAVWLKQNGVDIPGSTGLVSIPGTHGGIDGHIIVGWNYLINSKAGDYIELWWSSDSAKVYISQYPASSSPVYPSTASVVATIDMVGGFTPLSGDSCWVMFEGGDPNFPLWLGTF